MNIYQYAIMSKGRKINYEKTGKCSSMIFERIHQEIFSLLYIVSNIKCPCFKQNAFNNSIIAPLAPDYLGKNQHSSLTKH